MKTLIALLTLAISPLLLVAQSGYKVGDKIEDFSLVNVQNKSDVSLYSMSGKKAVVIVFASHNCPYTKIYEQRSNDFVKEYEQKGVGFIMINPNNPTVNPEDSFDEMMKASKERGYITPYLVDANQTVCDKFGASKTPEVFVLKSNGGSFILKYRGAIDDNPQTAKEVNANYLRDALNAVLNGQPVKISEKKPTGCVIHR